MLYSTDLKVYEIQDFCVETLKNDATFATLCTTELGAELNYQTDAPMNDVDNLPALPYCSAHGGTEEHDLLREEWNHPYEIALVFGIADGTEAEPTPPSVIENGIKKYTSSRKIELIAKEALKVIKDKMSASGINGDYDISIVSASGLKTPTGEASDMNYILSLNFNYLESISKEC